MSSIAELPCYTLINYSSDNETFTEAKLKEDLENGDIPMKTAALKNVMYQMLNGEKMPTILMTIIRFVLPSQDHTIKKLLLIFWEIVPKTSSDGKLLHEMILVCDAYRKDLEHPNEFIRGSTLRFLCKLKESELIEPLMPAIRACLEHRHSYVRRNAVFAIYTIYRNFDFLIPDAPELVFEFLEKEQDASCKRNAFMMLIHVDQDRALDYLSTCIDQVHSFNEILQLVIVELIYKVCIANPQERARFIKCIYNLLNSSSNAVRYEAAGTLVTLSSAPTAIKAAAGNYIELILKESDNNVKLIVLDKLIKLKENAGHEKVLQELVMDILRVLTSPDLEVRRKTLDLVLELVTLRNIEEVVMILKKEVTKTHTTDGSDSPADDAGNYRQILVRTLHTCCIKYPDVAPTVVPMLTEFLGDENEQAALEVLLFIREAVLKFVSLKPVILEKLLDNFHTIKNEKIHRHALWILGEHCHELEDIKSVMKEIKDGLGELPIVDDELKKMAGNKEEGEEESSTTSSTSSSQQRMVVTADGTYATQSALVLKTPVTDNSLPPLRGYLMKGNFFIGSVIGSTLAKLAFRVADLAPEMSNRFSADAMLIMTSIIHFGTSGMPERPMNEDDLGRLAVCIKVLSEKNEFVKNLLNVECRNAVASMLEGSKQIIQYQGEQKEKVVLAQADDSIAFMQLFMKQDQSVAENQFEVSLLQAINNPTTKKEEEHTSSQLNKVAQLTGFSDPIYAEAYVNVNQYDIVLDVLIVNQTSDTLQNVTLELATLGDLKLVEKPSPVTLAAHDFSNIKASVKVASTENGIIFGNIVYDVSGGSGDRNCVVLSDIHIDIMDYIMPASCTDNEFRTMWAEFEWENKVSVNTNIMDTREYLDHIIKSTNMKCLTPEKAISGDCGFLAANLYAKSIFGEDALANLSIEKPLDGTTDASSSVVGHIRIRAKSQGMALSLGDKINLSQKKPTKK